MEKQKMKDDTKIKLINYNYLKKGSGKIEQLKFQNVKLEGREQFVKKLAKEGTEKEKEWEINVKLPKLEIDKSKLPPVARFS